MKIIFALAFGLMLASVSVVRADEGCQVWAYGNRLSGAAICPGDECREYTDGSVCPGFLFIGWTDDSYQLGDKIWNMHFQTDQWKANSEDYINVWVLPLDSMWPEIRQLVVHKVFNGKEYSIPMGLEAIR